MRSPNSDGEAPHRDVVNEKTTSARREKLSPLIRTMFYFFFLRDALMIKRRPKHIIIMRIRNCFGSGSLGVAPRRGHGRAAFAASLEAG